MKRLLLLVLVAACGGRESPPPPPTYPPPNPSPPSASGPLSASLHGAPFDVRGIIGEPQGTGVLVRLFSRQATCGTPSAQDMPGEHYFQIYIEGWPNLAHGTHINLWNSRTAVNTVQSLPQGNGGSAQAMDGSITLLNVGAAGGTIMVDADNDLGSLRGQVPFAICQ